MKSVSRVVALVCVLGLRCLLDSEVHVHAGVVLIFPNLLPVRMVWEVLDTQPTRATDQGWVCDSNWYSIRVATLHTVSFRQGSTNAISAKFQVGEDGFAERALVATQGINDFGISVRARLCRRATMKTRNLCKLSSARTPVNKHFMAMKAGVIAVVCAGDIVSVAKSTRPTNFMLDCFSESGKI